MSKPLWINDFAAFSAQPLTLRLEQIRKHYCTGPCGQSMCVTATREATNKTLREAIKEIGNLENELRIALERE